VQPHEPALRAYLRHRFPSVDTDDIVQESYLRLLKERARGGVASAKAYVFAIARNTALAVFRRRKFISDVPVNELPDWCILDERPDAAAVANARQQFALAEEAIERLPTRCRDIMRLAAFEQRTPREIARILGIAESTVYVQLARGFRKCADYLRERGELP
jgi:RNA polymerase sigma-70 factor (ECF subfamily)